MNKKGRGDSLKIVNPTEDTIKEAASIIKRGGLVAFPTETVYGLGADGLNSDAVKRVFLAKKRPLSNPLPLHIADRSWLTELVHLNNKAEALMDGFWPGALTIILLKKDVVPDIVTAGFPKVGLRMPDNPIALELIRAVGRPIIGTSANITGFPSPTKASDVEKYLKDTVELILDGGVCQIGLESTILDLTEDIPKLLRRGGLAIEKIESLIVEVVTVCNTLLI